MVASAKFGSRWDGQNRVIHFLIFSTFDLRLFAKKQVLDLEANLEKINNSFTDEAGKFFF